jgi:hypothetical protein
VFLPGGASSEERDSVSYESVANRGDDGRDRVTGDVIGRYEAIFGRSFGGDRMARSRHTMKKEKMGDIR